MRSWFYQSGGKINEIKQTLGSDKVSEIGDLTDKMFMTQEKKYKEESRWRNGSQKLVCMGWGEKDG